MTTSKTIVMYESQEAATYRTDIKGWVSRDGLFHGDSPGSECSARWSGCTHQVCACGTVHEKSRSICDKCISKQRNERYLSMPVVEWDESTPVCVFDDDRYFFDVDSLLDWMADLKETTEAEGAKPWVQLVVCTPHHLGIIDRDHWCDDLAEDGDLPDEVAQKLEELNDAISRAPVVSWFPGKTRVDVDALWARLN